MVLCSLIGILAAVAGTPPSDGPGAASAEPGNGPDRTVALRVAVPFRVDRGWRYTWRADRPVVTEGWLLVVEVDPELARPRQDLSPVLMAGPWPVERITWGYDDPTVAVIVPEAVDLAETPLYWGPAALPEQLDPERCAAAAEAARRSGNTGVPAGELAAALLAGGGPRVLPGHKGVFDLGVRVDPSPILNETPADP